MAQINWKLIDAKVENLEEEMIGVKDSDLIKVFNWLDDNMMLTKDGRVFADAFRRECKRKGIKIN